MIQFLCPNGHRIHCPADRAGQPAKCPKCGVRFRIPLPDAEEAVAPSADGVAAGAAGSVDALRPGSGVALGVASRSDQIEFLCPNNHLLHGPATLQGRPGQCPECASRFRIPTYDEIEEQEETHSQIPVVPLSLEPGSLPAAAEEPRAAADGRNDAPPSTTSHPALALLTRLWPYRAQGAKIEIRYGSGQALVPDGFFPNLSQGSHGLFAVQQTDATHTLTAIAWEAIVSVEVRGVKRLPEDA